jgi:hypothetical protein
MAYELIEPREGDDDPEEEYIPPLTVATDVWAFAMTIIEVGIYPSGVRCTS